MKRLLMGMMALGFVIGTATTQASQHNHRLGLGMNYWVALDDVDIDDVDENGLSYLVTYQYRSGLLGLQIDFELLPDRFGDDAYAPAAYVVLGNALYAAAGIGMVHSDGDWADDPFYALKAGVDLNIVGDLYLDISLSYRFESDTKLEDALDDISTDTLFVGAAVRLGF